MRFVIEYVGAALVSVAVGAALLYVCVSAPDSALLQAGTMVEEEVSGLNRVGTEQTYTQEEMDQRITFTYDEKTYTAGIYESLSDRFVAMNAKGKQVPVKVDRVVASNGETCWSDEEGAIFDSEGIYSVYVNAYGTGYRVLVPVMEEQQKEADSLELEGGGQ